MFGPFENCRILFQSLLGHSGSMVFQSIFDDHPEVLMFPGSVGFYSIFCEDRDLEATWAAKLGSHLEHQYQVSPSTYGLGPNGDEVLPNQSRELVDRTGEIVKQVAFSRRNLFYAFYQAVAEVFGKDLRRIRWIWCHEHNLLRFLAAAAPAARADGLAFQIAINIRDPRSNWLSVRNSIRKELEKDPKNDTEVSQNIVYARSFQLYVSAAEMLEASPFHYDLIRLEDLQRQRFAFAKHYAAKLGLSPHPSLDSTTFCGKRFTGSWYSRAQDGISTTALIENWRTQFSGWEASAVERALAPELRAFGYAPPWIAGSSSLSLLALPWAFREIKETRRCRWSRAGGVSGKLRALTEEVWRTFSHGQRMIRKGMGNRQYSRLDSHGHGDEHAQP